MVSCKALVPAIDLGLGALIGVVTLSLSAVAESCLDALCADCAARLGAYWVFAASVSRSRKNANALIRKLPHFRHVTFALCPRGTYVIVGCGSGGSSHGDRSIFCEHGFTWRLGTSGSLRKRIAPKRILWDVCI